MLFNISAHRLRHLIADCPSRADTLPQAAGADRKIRRLNEPHVRVEKLEAVDFIVSDTLLNVGRRENLERLYHELLNKDWFMTLLDYKDYAAKREEIYKDYENRMDWARKMLVNTAKAGFFSSDRTIAEYDKDIWKLNP